MKPGSSVWFSYSPSAVMEVNFPNFSYSGGPTSHLQNKDHVVYDINVLCYKMINSGEECSIRVDTVN